MPPHPTSPALSCLDSAYIFMELVLNHKLDGPNIIMIIFVHELLPGILWERTAKKLVIYVSDSTTSALDHATDNSDMNLAPPFILFGEDARLMHMKEEECEELQENAGTFSPEDIFQSVWFHLPEVAWELAARKLHQLYDRCSDPQFLSRATPLRHIRMHTSRSVEGTPEMTFFCHAVVGRREEQDILVKMRERIQRVLSESDEVEAQSDEDEEGEEDGRTFESWT